MANRKDILCSSCGTVGREFADTGYDPVIGYFYITFIYCLKYVKERKEVGNCPLKKTKRCSNCGTFGRMGPPCLLLKSP